jgi:hypothetical protein
MPFYLITVCLKGERVATPTGKRSDVLSKGVRQWKSPDLDKVFQICAAKCRQKWGDRVISFDCVMISRHSGTYLDYIRGLEKKKGREKDEMGMYRILG